jgi:hypothetical protein
MKTEAVHSSKMPENLSTTWHKKLQDCHEQINQYLDFEACSRNASWWSNKTFSTGKTERTIILLVVVQMHMDNISVLEYNGGERVKRAYWKLAAIRHSSSWGSTVLTKSTSYGLIPCTESICKSVKTYILLGWV